MATVTATLSLTSTDLVSDSLSMSVSASISAAHAVGISRAKITSTAKGTSSGQVVLLTAADWTPPSYLYVKNTSSSVSDLIYVYVTTGTDDPIIARIAGGGFAFIPCDNSADLSCYASGSGVVVEYAVIGTEA
jgi:hypothetical protein